MFGHYAKSGQGKTKNPNPKVEKKPKVDKEQSVTEKTEKNRQEREKSKQAGFTSTAEFLKTPVEGLSPERRQAMEYEANKATQRQAQRTQRNLLGEQGQRGILGKSGVAYAQQRDLARLEGEARGQTRRDLDKLNEDLALKNKAAIFAGGYGEAAQSGLDRQIAIDEINLENERKKQKRYEDKQNREFNRI